MEKTSHSHQKDFCLDCALAQIKPFFPPRGPIKDFVAQNTLQGFLALPFDEALDKASSLYGSKTHMDLSYFRDKYKNNQISLKHLKEATDQYFPDLAPPEKDLLFGALFDFISIDDKKTFDALVKAHKIDAQKALDTYKMVSAYAFQDGKKSLISTIKKELEVTPEHQVNALLFRLVGAYTDQGVNLWPFLNKYNSLVKAVYYLAKESVFPLAPFVNNLDFSGYLESDYNDAIRSLLGKFLASPELYQDYLKETLLEHPGWSGMINVIEKNPNSLARKVNIGIKEFLLVKLALTWQFIKHNDPYFSPITASRIRTVTKNKAALSFSWWLINQPVKVLPTEKLFSLINATNLQRIWHSAMENQYYDQVRNIIARGPKPDTKNKKYQAVFCMDDRECSFRRHLEELNPEVETFGFPGFFGIDCYVKAHKIDLLDKICPVSVTPQHVIVEKSLTKRKITPEKKLLELASFISLHGANSTLFGFISAYTLGHLSLFRLMMSFFHPFKLIKTKQISSQDEKTYLQFERTENKSLNGLNLGYTHEEMADRVYASLNSMGLKKPAEMIFLIAHGSSSVNNPHFAAYDCGACSGRPGAINARAFALMANLPEVRQLIRHKGLEILDSTVFVGGFHDTCTDQVKFFDTENLSLKHSLMLNEFVNKLVFVCGKNAQERCQRFALAKANLSLNEALKEVQHRAKSLFEPRPELGHANNALCIVGRRARTYKNNFERRAFLQSYDPTDDPDGEILKNLLAAVIPVCGGINLEYFFSRLDPAIYGCGTKLSHNVCGLLGVGNGLDDDLRTGLPIQMTELHEPIRLLLIIEQTPEIILKSLKANQPLTPWVTNRWLKLASLDPNGQGLKMMSPTADDFV